MKLTCFGKYGPFPNPGCACSCYLLEYGGKKILIDLGCGSLTKVLEDLNVSEIDALVLSHLHADHMGDVLTLRYALDSAKKLGKRSKPLPVYMPAEPAAEAGLIVDCKMIEPLYISDGAEFDILGAKVKFALMPHSVPSFAMAFYMGDKKFVYSGDTKNNKNLAPFAKDADLLLIEAAFLERDLNGAVQHVSAGQAALIARDAGAKRMLMTHIFPFNNEDELLKEAREDYPWAEIIEESRTYEV